MSQNKNWLHRVERLAPLTHPRLSGRAVSDQWSCSPDDLRTIINFSNLEKSLIELLGTLHHAQCLGSGDLTFHPQFIWTLDHGENQKLIQTCCWDLCYNKPDQSRGQRVYQAGTGNPGISETSLRLADWLVLSGQAGPGTSSSSRGPTGETVQCSAVQVCYGGQLIDI